MSTYFFRFFEQLVHDGHVYVLETRCSALHQKIRLSPGENDLLLQRSRTRQSRDRTRRQAGDHSLQRPGEIRPKEFAHFIGKEMRLSKVEYAPKPEHVPL